MWRRICVSGDINISDPTLPPNIQVLPLTSRVEEERLDVGYIAI